jgi:vanillate O-demethylase ferredoxin subunit
VHLHHDDGPSAQKLDLSALLAAPPPGVHLYVCGPRGFIDAVLGAAKDRGWPDAQVHHEFFSGGIAARDADTDFTVSLARSGLAVQVHKDQTILQALAQVGVEVPSSCEQGVCGSCLTRVLEGEPDHRDVYLSSDERTRNDQILVCCSRSKSPLLVLDL